MTDVKPVTWTMRAEVNGQTFSLDGHGEADLTSGATGLELTASPDLSTGFDPALSQRICNFALAAYAAPPAAGISLRDAVRTSLFVRPARIARVVDESGEELVRLEALTTLDVTEDRIRVSNWMTGFSHLPGPIESIAGDETLTPQGPGAAVGVCTFTARVGGRDLLGLTVVPYRFDRALVVSPAVRTIHEERTTRTTSRTVSLHAVSRWTGQLTTSERA